MEQLQTLITVELENRRFGVKGAPLSLQ